MNIYLLNILHSLNQLDRKIFIFIQSLSADWLDPVMIVLRNPQTWIPVYVFIFLWIFRYHRNFLWQFVLLTIVTVALTDFVSASVLKPLFGRSRPCAEPALQGIIRDLVGCGGRFSMPSSHASNHFGLATYWYFSIKWMTGRKWRWLWLWAALICYAQIYVGKHYPADIIAGTFLGLCIGFLLAMLFRKLFLKKEL